MSTERTQLVSVTGEPLYPATRPSQTSDEPLVPAPTMEVIKGARIARRQIFRSPASGPWQAQMLLSIATAKALGFTLFEVDVVGTPPAATPTPKPPARRRDMIEVLMMGYSPDDPSEAAEGDCHVVVWAVVVE